MLLVACGLALVACSGPTTMPTDTPTLSPTTTPTPTIVWFPSTDTPSIFPTQPATAAVEYHPGVGNLIFSDTFDQPELWDTASSEQASASVTRNQLVLSISAPGPLSIVSLRNQPNVGDFYAEAVVNISLCSVKDQYGMIFRATSAENYYRFTVNCSSQLRLERVRGGEAYPLLDWLSSGDAPMGAPAQVKLGVWAVGREMRVFLNDHYQFSELDPVFSTGTVGFFIYASGQTPVTISFSSLSVYSVSYISPTPSLIPSHTPIPSPTLHP
ncbi:MAG: hypothetical protein ABSF99_06570 [Anaerolineales bacterium]